MLKIQKNSRQIPDIEIYTADKKYCDLLYGVLQEMSLIEDGVRYVKRKEINFTQIGKRIGLTRQTVATKLKNLEKLGLICLIEDGDEKEQKYQLNYLNKDVCALVPFETLKLMNDALSMNCISLYVYLLKRFIANGEKEYSVTMSQMKSFIGISTNTSSNNEVITNILKVLVRIGLVEYEIRQVEPDKTLYFITGVENTINQQC